MYMYLLYRRMLILTLLTMQKITANIELLQVQKGRTNHNLGEFMGDSILPEGGIPSAENIKYISKFEKTPRKENDIFFVSKGRSNNNALFPSNKTRRESNLGSKQTDLITNADVQVLQSYVKKLKGTLVSERGSTVSETDKNGETKEVKKDSGFLQGENGKINYNISLKNTYTPEIFINPVTQAVAGYNDQFNFTKGGLTNNVNTTTVKKAGYTDTIPKSDTHTFLSLIDEWKNPKSSQSNLQNNTEEEISHRKHIRGKLIENSNHEKIVKEDNKQTNNKLVNMETDNAASHLSHSLANEDNEVKQYGVTTTSNSLYDRTKMLQEDVNQAIVNTTLQLMKFIKLEKQLKRPDIKKKFNKNHLIRVVNELRKNKPIASYSEDTFKQDTNSAFRANNLGTKYNEAENINKEKINHKFKSLYSIDQYVQKQYGHLKQAYLEKEGKGQRRQHKDQGDYNMKYMNDRGEHQQKELQVMANKQHQKQYKNTKDAGQQQNTLKKVKKYHKRVQKESKTEQDQQRQNEIDKNYGKQQEVQDESTLTQQEYNTQQQENPRINKVGQNHQKQQKQDDISKNMQHRIQQKQIQHAERVNGNVPISSTVGNLAVSKQQQENRPNVEQTLQDDKSSSDILKTNSRQQQLQKLKYSRLRTIKGLIASLTTDPFDIWIYHQKTFDELGISPSLVKSSISNLGSSKPMQNVVRKAVSGKSVKLLIVGGSISAGGGLWKDRGNIDGIYHKAVTDWWKKTITSVTNSDIDVNNVAIGGTDSEFFSYCLNNFLNSAPDLVLWELSANDYNRYNERDFDPGRPLEQLTRLILQLPSHPALIYVNFFRGDRQNMDVNEKCPNSEESEVEILSRYYDIPSLSWRKMVCNLITKRAFVNRELFSEDGYHPSLLGHAQVAMLLTLYVKGIFESVLADEINKFNNGDNGFVSQDFLISQLKLPVFKDPLHPQPRCWTLLTPNSTATYINTLNDVNVLNGNSFELNNVTAWDIRTDRIQCLLSNKPGALLDLSINIPVLDDDKDVPLSEAQTRTLAIATHNKYGGAADVQLDELPSKTPVVTESGVLKQSIVHIVSENIRPGVHNLKFRALSSGFCLTSIMVL